MSSRPFTTSRLTRAKLLYFAAVSFDIHAMSKLGLYPLLACLAVGGWMLAASASTLTSPPQSPFIVETWDAEDGLPQSSVFSVIQTRDGYLWLGTASGLVRFDGFRFEVFDENNTPGLPSSRVMHLFEDSKGTLWIGTESGGVVLVKDGRVRAFGSSEDRFGKGASEARLVASVEDATGAMWLYTADGQLARHADGNVVVWNLGNQRPSVCRALAAEPERLWVGSDAQLVAIGPLAKLVPPELPQELVLPVNKLDFLLTSARGGYWRFASGRIQKCRGNSLLQDFGLYPWAGAPVSAACEDLEGNLIVGTYGSGVWWFDAAGKATRLSNAEGLSHTYVRSLTVDKEGNLWVGTDGGGLNCVKRKKFRVAPASKGWVVQTACDDGAGGVWMGFNGFGGVSAVFARGGDVKEFGAAQGLAGTNVLSAYVDRSGQVWMGTVGGLFKLAGERFEAVTQPDVLRTAVIAIHQDRRGQLWFGTAAGLVRWDGSASVVYSTRNGKLASEIVRALADDAEGNLWIGTMGGGLNRLREDAVTVFRKDAGGLPSDDISALMVDRKGALWIGTGGNGLARLDRGQWARYSTLDGLPGNSIGFLVEDQDGHVWLGSNGGLARLAGGEARADTNGIGLTLNCRVFGKADGLPTRECWQGSQPAAWRAANGALLFATTRGLVTVSPAELHPNPVPPPVVIESVAIEGLPPVARTLRAAAPQEIAVPPGRQRVEIQFTSLNLGTARQALFRHRMLPYETEWTPPRASRETSYPKLPSGDFRFEVQACNEDGVWSAVPAALTVIVQPPFWRTWWFMTTAALTLLVAIVGTVHLVSTQKLKRQLRQQAALEKERARIARDLHDQLGASLTQVSLLGELVEADKDLPDAVEGHARQITQTARETTRAFDEIVWATNPANDTLEGLINYVCKYAQEYLALADLRYRLEVPSPLPAVPLLPEVRHNVFLAAKEAVNNVVKHAQAQSAWVRLRVEAARFTLEIEDDGRGVPDGAKASLRNGLKNMRKRLEDVGGRFTIEPAPQRGTVVRLIVPLRTPDSGLRTVS